MSRRSSVLPPIPRPVGVDPWVEVSRTPMKGDDRFLVRYSMARESVQRRPAWSISILERGKGHEMCKPSRSGVLHKRSECRKAPAVVVRVFYDARMAREARDDAVRGHWGKLYALPGAPPRAARDKSPGWGDRTPQGERVLLRDVAAKPPRSAPGPRTDERTPAVSGAVALDPQTDWELYEGTWYQTVRKAGSK